VDNLSLLLHCKGLYAPSTPYLDTQLYKKIHDEDIQNKRSIKTIPCGQKGNLQDYVPFYFGPHSPMLFRLYKGEIGGIKIGQEPIIYLVGHAQDFHKGEFVFSNGHGIHHITQWYDDLKDLNKVDWSMVGSKFWKDDPFEDNDRQRRKQAEFLVYKFCCWTYIRGIAVFNQTTQTMVLETLQSYPKELHRPVEIMKKWYY
jgi:hypothetical protein